MLRKSKVETYKPPKRSAAHKHAQRSVVWYPIDRLLPNPRNPRLHSRKHIRQIGASILAFGFLVPILIDLKMRVLAGHGRLEAAKELGWSEVPTLCVDHLTDEQAAAFTIADNRLTEIAVWDEKLLAEQLKFLCSVDLDFDIETIGFDTPEIDLMIAGLDGAPSDKEDPADSIEPSDQGPAVSESGNLWVMGRHRIFCGNALEAASYSRLMDGKLAGLVFTDPPYNVRIHGHASGLGPVRHRDFAMATGEMTDEEFTRFLARFGALVVKHSRDGSIHFICMDWRHVGEVLAATRKVYSELKNICVWVKHNAGMGSLYRSQHELVFVFKNGKAAHRNNVELGKHGRHRSNVWSYRGANDFGRGTDEGDLLSLHPTVKPVALIQDAILDCSARDDIVLDPFLGIGSTCIAAERAGRSCYGIEIDPSYVDTIIRRWQRFTGDDARLERSGETFNDMQAKGGDRHGQSQASSQRKIARRVR